MSNREEITTIKPLDIVMPIKYKGCIGMITEIGSFETGDRTIYQASIDWIYCENQSLHNAWWQASELEVISSVPILVSMAMAHPFGNGKDYVERSFPIIRQQK